MKTLALQHKPNNSTLQSFLVASGIYAVIFLSLFYGSSYLVPKDIGLQTQTMAISLMHFAQNPAVQKSAPPPIQEEIKTLKITMAMGCPSMSSSYHSLPDPTAEDRTSNCIQPQSPAVSSSSGDSKREPPDRRDGYLKTAPCQ